MKKQGKKIVTLKPSKYDKLKNLQLSSRQLNFVNEMVREFPCVMLLVRKKQLYLALKHYRFVRYQDAPLAKLGTNNSSPDYYYVNKLL